MSDNKGSTPARRPRSLERRPVPRDRSEDVAHAIGLRIVGGNPPPGSLLPTEHQLAAEIGVSRAALREGFRLLAARGMIIGRRKVGTMVRPMADWNMLDASVLAWHLEQEPTEAFIDGLFEARLIVEPAAAAMAAQRAHEDQVGVMREALREMAVAQGAAGNGPAPDAAENDDIDKTVGADLRFHKAVLAAAGNHFLATFGALIGSSLIASFRLNWRAHNSAPAISLALHEDVLNAITARDAQAAEGRMRVLLSAAQRDARLSLAWNPAQSELSRSV
ncbi:FadR/GntR family transcriptional regulator [Acidisoma sp.]|uniref:FadR/GntR family transcriptional regulator n=1 Tax=Acidisoma sp. TaxID=1872115 RepID=UPI003AFFC128